ncbi:MAG TPA: serine hydrolase [Firmicutes bacterium]|nr:serine hydrolase [Bacillota bacterium]
MQLEFLGAAETVSGSCFLLRFGIYQVLVDCGMFHGPRELKERNYGSFPFNPLEIDAVILTHAHIDHSGLLPKLVKHGFSGPIYATDATADLCTIMLPDSAYIQEAEVERKNRRLSRQGKPLLEPIYTKADADKTLAQFRPMVYDERVEILPGLAIRMRDAGHILGAALVEVWVTEEGGTVKLVFSGDMGNLDQPIVQDPTFLQDADYVIVESTYGTRLHQDRENRRERLAEVVRETMARGGNLLIPAFALGRTQDLLHELRKLLDAGEIPPVKVYVDSPLATSATEIFRKHQAFFDFETRTMLEEGRSPFEFAGLHYTQSVEDSKRLNDIRGGAIIISASGMCDAGRIKHHLRHNLWRPEAAVLLIGYQAEGTLGRQLQDGAKEVRIHGEQVRVRAKIHTITGFSAHGDREALMGWLGEFKDVKRVFVVHGEKSVAREFAQDITDKLGLRTIVPRLDEVFELSPNTVERLGVAGFSEAQIDPAFAGVIKVWEGQEQIFSGTYGFASRRFAVPNTSNTRFNMASGSRIFTAVAAALLADEGKFTFNTPALCCLRDGLPPWARDLTIAELFSDGEGLEQRLELVGRIVEAHAEEPFAAFAAARIFTPVGMASTGYYLLNQLPEGTAVGYLSSGSEWVENILAVPLQGGPSGGAYTTADDLHRFWWALLGGDLVSEAVLPEVLRPFASRTRNGLTSYTVWGTGPGSSMVTSVIPALEQEVTILSNGEAGTGDIYQTLMDFLEKR